MSAFGLDDLMADTTGSDGFDDSDMLFSSGSTDKNAQSKSSHSENSSPSEGPAVPADTPPTREEPKPRLGSSGADFNIDDLIIHTSSDGKHAYNTQQIIDQMEDLSLVKRDRNAETERFKDFTRMRRSRTLREAMQGKTLQEQMMNMHIQRYGGRSDTSRLTRSAQRLVKRTDMIHHGARSALAVHGAGGSDLKWTGNEDDRTAMLTEPMRYASGGLGGKITVGRMKKHEREKRVDSAVNYLRRQRDRAKDLKKQGQHPILAEEAEQLHERTVPSVPERPWLKFVEERTAGREKIAFHILTDARMLPAAEKEQAATHVRQFFSMLLTDAGMNDRKDRFPSSDWPKHYLSQLFRVDIGGYFYHSLVSKLGDQLQTLWRNFDLPGMYPIAWPRAPEYRDLADEQISASSRGRVGFASHSIRSWFERYFDPSDPTSVNDFRDSSLLRKEIIRVWDRLRNSILTKHPEWAKEAKSEPDFAWIVKKAFSRKYPDIDYRLLGSIEMLLVMSGIEENPGPRHGGGGRGPHSADRPDKYSKQAPLSVADISAAITATVKQIMKQEQGRNPEAKAPEPAKQSPVSERKRLSIVRPTPKPSEAAHPAVPKVDPGDPNKELLEATFGTPGLLPGPETELSTTTCTTTTTDGFVRPEDEDVGKTASDLVDRAEEFDDFRKDFIKGPQQRSTAGSNKVLQDACKKYGAVAQSVSSSVETTLGEQDAKIERLNDTIMELRKKNKFLAKKVELADDMFDGYADETVAREYSFHGYFEDPEHVSFDPNDDVVTVRIHPGGRWECMDLNGWPEFYVSRNMLAVAAKSALCDDKVRRFRNILQALASSRECQEDFAKSPVQLRIDIVLQQSRVAFLLTGLVAAAGRLRWLSNVSEWITPTYRVQPPEDWRERLAAGGIILDRDNLAVQAKFARCARGAPWKVRGLTPHMCDWGDLGTMVAGICKRLLPELPPRMPYMQQCIEQKVTELLTIFHDTPGPTQEEVDQYIAEKLSKYPLQDRAELKRGIDMFHEDNEETINRYLETAYKAFVKMEVYVRQKKAPPRFIMSLPLWARGVQIAAMSRILLFVERATEVCNVKHLTTQQITEKLKRKFGNCSLVAETDFSSFESCLTHELRQLIEVRIFNSLAATDYERDFIDLCIDRDTVAVLGPGWHANHFHHIRMSGDQWTSIGNLLANLVLTCAIRDVPMEQHMKECLVEGDDGAMPAPKDPEERARWLKRAADCGVLLTFDEAPWDSLSFCGNHFVSTEGIVIRSRDPMKALMNLIIVFNPKADSHNNEPMLQRSKCLSVLDGPWIPMTSVFAAVIERASRSMKIKVDEDYLLRNGLMKEYAPYGIEKCVPEWLLCDAEGMFISDKEFARRVAAVDQKAGGTTCQKDVMHMLLQAKSGFDVFIDLPQDVSGDRNSWQFRDGIDHTFVVSDWLNKGRPRYVSLHPELSWSTPWWELAVQSQTCYRSRGLPEVTPPYYGYNWWKWLNLMLGMMIMGLGCWVLVELGARFDFVGRDFRSMFMTGFNVCELLLGVCAAFFGFGAAHSDNPRVSYTSYFWTRSSSRLLTGISYYCSTIWGFFSAFETFVIRSLFWVVLQLFGDNDAEVRDRQNFKYYVVRSQEHSTAVKTVRVCITVLSLISWIMRFYWFIEAASSSA